MRYSIIMATTIGQRAKQEANAYKARAWFRGMESMVYGTGIWRGTDGKKLKMRHELRGHRIEHHATAWATISSVELLGVCHSPTLLEKIHEMMDMLLRQTPDIFSSHETQNDNIFESHHIADAQLGTLQFSQDLWEEKLTQSAFTLPNFSPLFGD